MTEEIDFEEDNVPPRLVNDPAGVTPLNQIIEIDVGESPAEVRFSFLIEDDNIGQRWEVKWRASYLDSQGQTVVVGWENVSFGYIPPLPDRARVEFPISESGFPRHRDPMSQLVGTCVVMDVRVSSGFTPSLPHEDPSPLLEGDMAAASWVVWFVNADTPVNPASCPTHRVRLQP